MSDPQSSRPADSMPPPPLLEAQLPAVSEAAAGEIILAKKRYSDKSEAEQALVRGHFFAHEHISVRALAKTYNIHYDGLYRLTVKENWADERTKFYAKVTSPEFKPSYLKRARTLDAVMQAQADLYYERALIALQDGTDDEASFSHGRFKTFLKFQSQFYDALVASGQVGGMTAQGNEPLVTIDIADHPKLADVLNVVLKMIASKRKPSVDKLDPAIIDAEARAIDPAKGERR